MITEDNTNAHYAAAVQIPMKRGKFFHEVEDLSSTGQGMADTYDPRVLAEQAIQLLIDYINHQTKGGGYYRNVGNSHLERMTERMAADLQVFSTDTSQRTANLNQKLYDDKGFEDDVQFEFKRCGAIMKD